MGWLFPNIEDLKENKDVEGLIKALNYPVFIREKAVEALVEIGKDSVPALIEALKNKSNRRIVREKAVEALGKIGDARAIPALMEVLRDKNDSVQLRRVMDYSDFKYKVIRDDAMQKMIVEALGKIGDARAIPALMEVLRDKSNREVILEKAVEALGKIGKDAAPALMEVLRDKSNREVILEKAVEALGKIGKDAAPALIKAIKEKDLQKEIIEVLIQIKNADPEGYKEKMLEVAKNYEKAARWEEAAEIYEEMEMWEKAGEVRKIALSPKPVQLQYIEKIDMSTSIKDSVIHKSVIGSSEPDEPVKIKKCPYCGEEINLPKTPKYCPYCGKKLL